MIFLDTIVVNSESRFWTGKLDTFRAYQTNWPLGKEDISKIDTLIRQHGFFAKDIRRAPLTLDVEKLMTLDRITEELDDAASSKPDNEYIANDTDGRFDPDDLDDEAGDEANDKVESQIASDSEAEPEGDAQLEDEEDGQSDDQSEGLSTQRDVCSS